MFSADLENVTAVAPVSRRRLLATAVPSNEITNPIMCLAEEDMVLFKVTIDSVDRTKSHYPVYQKNHLFNSNPSFDYGAFNQLKTYIENTNMTITSFAHVFPDAGNYVFRDAQNADRWVSRSMCVLLQMTRTFYRLI